MTYVLIFIFICITNNLFSKDIESNINKTTIAKNTYIKVSLKTPISPTDAVVDKFKLSVEEYVYNNSYRKILLTKNTEIICKEEKIDFKDDNFIIKASCDTIVLPNETEVKFQGEIHDKTGKEDFSINYNSNALEGTQLTLKIKEDLDLQQYLK